MPETSNPSILCAEDIAASFLLRRVAVPPSRNSADCLPASSDQYTLSLDTERELASTLAFLAHSKDDVDHIPAVCIEEDIDSRCLNVIFAVNKDSYSGGDDAIRRIKQGFESILTVLVQISSDASQHPDIRNKILAAVVSMCSPRILCRLRLVSSHKATTKRPFKGTLDEALLAVENISRQKLLDRNLIECKEQFRIRANKVGKLLALWSRYRADTPLIEVVEGVHQIQKLTRLPELIRMIPNQDMSPTARENLLNIVGKISRYREAARFLYRTAKTFPIVRAMRAISVHLPREAYDAPLLKKYTPDLQSKMAKVSARGSQRKLLQEICTVLNLTQQRAMEQYSTQVLRTLKKRKVHAEIQLIAHCELQRPKLLPRVICSSKDACFLCNLFIRLYRKVYTPRSHGRLYPSWCLPSLAQFSELERKFSQSLDDHFRETCDALLSTRKKTVYPDPHESTLFTLPLYSTTTMATSPVLSDGRSESQFTVREDSSDTLLPNPTRVPSVENADGSENENTPLGSSDQLHHHEKGLDPGYHILLQGSKEDGHLILGETSRVYRAGPLRIHIEHATGSRSLEYSIEWLGVKESIDARGSPTPVVNTQSLQGTVNLHEERMFYLTVKDTVLKVSWASGGIEPVS
ncbi:hypothetical protein BJX76DRAFT_358500 [Aspergillus varians]